jgi:hypothetical protein
VVTFTHTVRNARADQTFTGTFTLQRAEPSVTVSRARVCNAAPRIAALLSSTMVRTLLGKQLERASQRFRNGDFQGSRRARGRRVRRREGSHAHAEALSLCAAQAPNGRRRSPLAHSAARACQPFQC